VAYAHRQLLVHRDLKPGNVLVNAEGQVKLLDFGIAKALEDDATDATMTQQGQRPFTPHYASPEQVRGEPVGTGTDIYSLGVLLYQLLTGLRPYGRDATTPFAAARCVLEEAPTKPSSLSADLVADPQWLATRRRLVGDLDNILLKALEKPLERRYPSVDALAADLRAYLGGYPVSARAARWHYVAGRFIARNRMAAAVAAVGLLGIVASLVAALWQAHRADQARAVAERRFAEVRQLANDLVFKYHDRIANLPGSIATRDALLVDALRYLDGLRGDGNSTLDAGLARELAESYFRIALLQGEQFSPSQERLADAQASLEKAIALLPRYIEAPSPPVEALHDAAKIWITRHTQMVRAGRLAVSLEALEQARSVIARAQRLDPAHLVTLSLQATLEGRVGIVQGGSATSANLGRTEPALTALLRSEALMAELEAREPASAEWVHQHAWACQNLASAFSLLGRSNEALVWASKGTVLRDAAAEREPGDPHYLQARATARLLQSRPASELGRHGEALALVDSGMALARRALASDPQNKVVERDLALGHLARGRVLASAGRATEARAALDQALPRLIAPAGDVALDFYLARMRAEALIWYARVLPAHEAAAALAAAREAAALMAPPPGTTQDENAARAWTHALALGEIAAAQATAGDAESARSAARQALAVWHASPGGRAPGLYAAQQQRVEAIVAAAPHR
jgi:tetratricopeptide (TPR) repeat protein